MDMSLKSFDAFILDLDGTLIDSETYHAQAFADAVLAQSGYRLTDDEHREFFGSHSISFSIILNERHGLALEPEQVLNHKRERVREIFEAKLFSGARDFLEVWNGRKAMALATNSPLSFVQPALEQVGLTEYFDCITTDDEITHRKPSPEIIETTIRKLKTNPAKTLVFEDQLIGIEAALAAGAKVVVINNDQTINHSFDVPVHTWQELISMSELS